MMGKAFFRGGAAAALAAPAVLLFAGGPALAAADGDVVVTNAETVQAYLNASGKVDTTRIYEQVAMKGKGTVNLSDPVEPKGLRNLDGFGGFEVKGGNLVGTYQVDGEQRIRTVSDYTKKLPLEVEVVYTLDGKTVKPGDVVGKSGRLKVQYTVRNVTGTSQEVSFDDGTGKTATATEDVVIPMVGSLSTVLPSTFTDVKSGEANMAGDGRGATKMSFTMTLFGPIGKPEATFGYEAQITDGVVPKASISALPVSPLDSPSFKGGAASYKSGAATGATLTAGATEIDANLLKLRDGAGDLLAGLIKLRDGADKLNTGLADTAAPGAEKLAAGANDLKDGTSKLRAGAGDAKAGSAKVADGAGKVAGGAGQLNDGAGQLLDGLQTAGEKAPALLDGLAQVADGLDQLDAGLLALHGGIGDLPDSAVPLHVGITKLRAGIGAKGSTGTLIDGVDQIREGLATAVATGGSIDRLQGGVDQSLGGVRQVNIGLADALRTGGSIDVAQATIASIKNVPACNADATCRATVDGIAAGVASSLRTSTTAASGGLGQVDAGLSQVSPGVTQLKTSLTTAVGGLVRVECGLSNKTLPVCPAATPGLLEGVSLVDAGVDTLVNGVVAKVQGAVGDTKDVPKDKTLRGGVHGLQGGVDLIGEGGITLIDGLTQLEGGAAKLKGGTSDLAAGAGDLSDGAGQLDSGLGTLADGTGKLDDGAGQLSDGAGQLAAGLGDAADGSGQLADGLQTAADGAPKLENGAQKLSDEGTKKLIVAGKATASDYGQKYALIEAGAKRAQVDGMAYGAPENAAGSTAYSYELAGADGEGGRNLGRGLGAAAVFGLAGGAGLLRKRFV